MPTSTWEFELKEKRHSVELEHTNWTGRRTITVSGCFACHASAVAGIDNYLVAL